MQCFNIHIPSLFWQGYMAARWEALLTVSQMHSLSSQSIGTWGKRGKKFNSKNPIFYLCKHSFLIKSWGYFHIASNPHDKTFWNCSLGCLLNTVHSELPWIILKHFVWLIFLSFRFISCGQLSFRSKEGQDFSFSEEIYKVFLMWILWHIASYQHMLQVFPQAENFYGLCPLVSRLIP